MKFTAQDWRSLCWPISSLVMVILLSTLLVGYMQSSRDGAHAALQFKQQTLSEARQRQRFYAQEKADIANYWPGYQRLLASGFVGAERRMDWVDTLGRVRLEYHLFDIDYQLAQTEQYQPVFVQNVLDVATLTLHRSVMQLSLPMLHEGDLLSLLNGLQAAQTAPLIVRQCTITRLADGNDTVSQSSGHLTAEQALLPGLSTQCELDWLTITAPATQGAA